MSENRYTIEGLVGEFRLVPRHPGTLCCHCSAYRGFGLGCIAVKRDDIDCSGKILELIPGTDAPAVDPRDVEIADLRAKLAALESVKPVAVLPTITAAALNRMANSLDDSQPIRQRERAWCDGINEWFLSRIQPVDREYLAALEELFSAMSEGDEHFKISFSLTEFPGGVACLDAIGKAMGEIDDMRARLAAGKGGE